VSVRLSESYQSSVYEHRSHDPHIAEMRAAAVRVVDEKDISRIDVAAEALDHRLGSEVQRSDVNCDVGATLHHGVAVRVA
jgi:hypothetical protein